MHLNLIWLELDNFLFGSHLEGLLAYLGDRFELSLEALSVGTGLFPTSYLLLDSPRMLVYDLLAQLSLLHFLLFPPVHDICPLYIDLISVSDE